MSLTYTVGATTVSLRVEHSTVEQNAVYSENGKDLLHTHFRISVRAIWAPRATNNAGAVGVSSIAALRQILMTPRGQLVFGVPAAGTGRTILLRTPLFNVDNVTPMRSDANNGPTPVSLNVIEFMGEQSAVVDYVIETWILECPLVRGVLSNRWESSMSYDQDYFSTRMIRGTAILRAEWVNQQVSPATAADQTIQLLVPGVPEGFRRVYMTRSVAPDSLSVSYEVHDQQQPVMIHPNQRSKISRVAGYYMEHDGVIGIDPSVLIRGAVQGARAGAGGGARAAGIGAIVGVIGAAADTVTFPKTTITFELEVWGYPSATRTDLVNALIAGIVAFRFNGNSLLDGAVAAVNNVVGLIPGGAAIAVSSRCLLNSMMFSVDLFNKHAKCQCVAEFPAIFLGVLRLFGIQPGLPLSIQSGGVPELITGLTSAFGVGNQGPGFNNQTRTANPDLNVLTTPPLHAPCEEIAAPPGI